MKKKHLTKREQLKVLDRMINNEMRSMALAKTEGDYEIASKHVDQLYKFREKLKPTKQGVSVDTIVKILAETGLVLVVLYYEHGHVITSKAFPGLFSNVIRRS